MLADIINFITVHIKSVGSGLGAGLMVLLLIILIRGEEDDKHE